MWKRKQVTTTDKQIIIDEVNISECKLYVPTLNKCVLGYGSCDKNKNCYYKQLKHKEQAIEKVKEIIQKELANCEYWGDCTSCEYDCGMIQILQICDEVDNDLENN